MGPQCAYEGSGQGTHIIDQALPDRPRYIRLVPLASCPPKTSPMHQPRRDSRVEARPCHACTTPDRSLTEALTTTTIWVTN